MKRSLLAFCTVFAVAACAAMAQQSTPPASPKEMKVAFDITNGNPKAVLATLEVIDTTRKQLIASGVTPKIVLAFRGDASYFTQTDASKIKEADRADAGKIAAKIHELRGASGVEALEQCNLPLAPRKLNPASVVADVKVVPNGWISLAQYQQQGYAYIVP